MAAISFSDNFIPASRPCNLEKYASHPQNVLVIAPHPDDDVIAAGGTMALLAKQGKNLFSVYVTDGCAGSSSAAKSSSTTTIRIRQNEAMAALRIVRAKGGIFLALPSRQLLSRQGGGAGQKKILEVIQFFMPKSVYVPSPLERHITHGTVTRLTIAALRQIEGYTPKLWGYSVWGGLYGMQGLEPVDISQTAAIKRRAIRMHRSQITGKAYDEGIMGRNRYEAVFLETHARERFRYVETFLDMQALLFNKRLGLKGFCKSLLRFKG